MNEYPTPNPEVNGLLTQMVTEAKAILGDNFLACYLQGSFAVGDWDADSDIDFITVVQRPLSDAEYKAIEAMHARIFAQASGWSQHLEGSYFPQDILKRTETRDTPLPFLDNAHNVLERSTHCNTLVVRWVTREHGITLDGPPPAEYIAPVSADALRREILATMHRWADEIYTEPQDHFSRWYQPYIVVMFCRMLHSIETGHIESKIAGIRWATSALAPEWIPLMERAWQDRPNPGIQVRLPADPQQVELTIAFVRYAVALGESKMHTT